MVPRRLDVSSADNDGEIAELFRSKTEPSEKEAAAEVKAAGKAEERVVVVDIVDIVVAVAIDEPLGANVVEAFGVGAADGETVGAGVADWIKASNVLPMKTK